MEAPWPLLLHLAATWFMVGLIWFVQLVHYPLMAWARQGDYVAFQLQHQQRTSWVVAPAMLLELTSALWCTFRGLAGGGPWLAALALLGLVWGSTAFWQMPLHARLAQGFVPQAHARLVQSNWLRTAAWTLRGLLVAAQFVPTQF